VYAYQVVLPQPSRRLGAIRALLKNAMAAARASARTWSGRLVLERRATHILIVTDTPERNTSISHLLEAELARLAAAFSVTAPLAVAGHTAGGTPWTTSRGNGR
jgi:hypothetical protein